MAVANYAAAIIEMIPVYLSLLTSSLYLLYQYNW